MTTLPAGMYVRRPIMADVPAVFHLMLARNRAEYGEVDTTEEHIRDFWQAPDFNLRQDAWIVQTADGRPVGYASVWHIRHTRIYTYFTALPEYDQMQIKAHLLELIEERAQQFLAAAPTDVPVTIGTGIAAVNLADQRMLAQAGYHQERGQWRMEIELHQPPPPPAPWPEGIAVRPCNQAQDLHAIFATYLDAFSEQKGYTQPTFESWVYHNVNEESFDPSLWFLACEGETIAGISLCRYWAGSGFVSALAVLRPWRRKGLGLSLLYHSFSEFYRRGTRIIKLMVDTQNPTGATQLYERAAMRITRLHYLYEKELRAGKEPK